MSSNESTTDRVIDYLVGAVLLIPKIAVLLWVLLAGGVVPAAITGVTPVATAEVAVATEAPEVEEVVAQAATEVPPTPTMEIATAGPAVEAPSIDEAGVLDPLNIFLNPVGLAGAWAASQVGGSAIDPSTRQPGWPPHLLATFTDPDNPDLETALAELINVGQAQLRVIPVDAYLAMLGQTGMPDPGMAFEQIKALLEQQPADFAGTLPIPPVLADKRQEAISRLSYLDFDGGQGVAYLAHLAGQGVGPITNETGFTWIFQGLTDDGRNYLLGLWPVAADFLPETVDSVDEDTLAAVQDDLDAYLATIQDETNSATDGQFTPDLSALAGLVSGMVLGDRAAELASQGDTGSEGDTPELLGTVWQWTAFEDSSGENNIEVGDPASYLLTLWPDGSYNIKADCNVGGGSYELDGSSLIINPGFSTLAACPPDSLSDNFTRLLFDARTYVFDDDGNLVLNLMADAGNMVFANGGPADVADAGDAEEQTDAAEAGLTGVVLEWDSFTDADGNTTAVENPENYTIILNEDGTFDVEADCNVGGGVYEFDPADGSVNLTVGRLTRALCPPDSLSDDFLANLEAAESVSVGDDGVVTANLADGGNVTFRIGAAVDAGDGEMAEIEMAPTDEIIGVTWQWTEFQDTAGINDLVIENPENYQLVLWPDGAYSVQADCNIGRGSYELDGQSISFGPGPFTRALCGPESQGDLFIQYLDGVRTYVIDDDGNLVLNLFADAGNMIFANAGDAETTAAQETEEQPDAADAGLTGTSLRWTSFVNEDGDEIVIENPDDYQLVLLPDGTYTIIADCNVGGGTFEFSEGGSILLYPGPLTRALCPPDSLSDDFLAFLNGITNAVVRTDGTIEATLEDGRTGTFDTGSPVAEGGPTGEPIGGPDEAAEMQVPDDLVNTLWQWTEFQDSSGANDIAVPNPEQYQLLFLPGGTYAFRADCNTGSGGFEVDGSSLTILPGITTLAACGEDSLDQVYLQLLGDTASYVIDDDGNLVLNLMADAGNMVFSNAGEAAELPMPVVEETEGPAEAPADLVNTLWQWTEFEDTSGENSFAVDNPQQYQLLFLPDGTYAFRADCNTGSGSYEVDGASLTILPGITTLAACGDDSLDTQYLQFLGDTASYVIDEDGNLVLNLMADAGNMIFGNAGTAEELPAAVAPETGAPAETVAANPLEGTSWQWTNFRDPKQEFAPPSDQYTITFLPDGQVAVQADCNNGSGSYSVDGSSINISILVTTAAACGEGSLGDSFIEKLNFAGVYTVDGNTLRIDLMADGGTMTFVRLP